MTISQRSVILSCVEAVMRFTSVMVGACWVFVILPACWACFWMLLAYLEPACFLCGGR